MTTINIEQTGHSTVSFAHIYDQPNFYAREGHDSADSFDLIEIFRVRDIEVAMVLDFSFTRYFSTLG